MTMRATARGVGMWVPLAAGGCSKPEPVPVSDATMTAGRGPDAAVPDATPEVGGMDAIVAMPDADAAAPDADVAPPDADVIPPGADAPNADAPDADAPGAEPTRPAPLTLCGAACVDPSTDARSCGGCGVVRPSATVCAARDTRLSTIERAAVSADGVLGRFAPWGSGLMRPRSGHVVEVIGGYVYVFGGGDERVERADIGDGGSLTAFATHAESARR